MIIVEGIDGVGKSTFIEQLSLYGYRRHHFNFDEKNMNLFLKYSSVLEKSNEKTALDRSFISEMVYGPIIRGRSKLTDSEYIKLLKLYGSKGFQLFYLHATEECLLERRKDNIEDYKIILQYYELLVLQYQMVIKIANDYLDVSTFDTKETSVENMIDITRKSLKL